MRFKEKTEENKRKQEFFKYKLKKFKKTIDKLSERWYNNTRSIKKNKIFCTDVLCNKYGGKIMSTYMAKSADVERKWYIIDAEGKPLGRVAATAAMVLRGKHKPTFTPHVDCGDHVIIINAEKAVLTGKKLTDKYHIHHTGWIGGLKMVQYKELMAKKPELAFKYAIEGMLPHNTLGRKAATRLRVYKGAEHEHAAQKPEAWTQNIK